MSLAFYAYGTVEEVAAFTRRYAGINGYNNTPVPPGVKATLPSLKDVENFIDRLSARVNGYLAEAGFAVPLTNAMARNIMADFVIATAVDYCHWANSAGRFNDSKTLKGRSFSEVIDGEAQAYITEHAEAIEQLGETRTRGLAWGLQTRTVDAQGNPIIPMFQQRAFNWNILDAGT